VNNTGPVVPPDAVDRLFEPVRRGGPERTGDHEGHGLGLSIVRAVADVHGAVLTIEPRPEGRLEVTVLFPAGQPEGDGP
jgi:signal transduction histidine kinase